MSGDLFWSRLRGFILLARAGLRAGAHSGLLHSRMLSWSTILRCGERCGDGSSVMLGEISIQIGEMASERLCGLLRVGNDGGMKAAGGEIGTHADPAERWVLVAGFDLARAGVGPRGGGLAAGIGVKSGECITRGG